MEYAPAPPQPIVVSAVAVEAAPARVEYQAPENRPRLSRTVTLGQGSDQMTYTAERPVVQQGAGAPQGNTTVIVNMPPSYGGYPGYGYGYGNTYGWSRGYSERGGGSSGRGSWGATGFEGPHRTAAPGQTPGVGGNWAPPRSFGPAPLR